MATLFSKYFETKYVPSTFSQPLDTTKFSCSIIIFTQSNVKDALTHFKNSKAIGPDQIPIIFWKTLSDVLVRGLTYIFNLMLSENFIPTTSIWKNLIIQLFKTKNSKYAPSNYRPISITCSLGRILEKVVYYHLLHYIIPLISPTQHGFCKTRLSVTNLMSSY